MNREKIKLVAMDLDGTLTQHKSPLDPQCRYVLERLAQRYSLLMVCAGGCERVYRQMGGFPIQISGFYGMEYADATEGNLQVLEQVQFPVDHEDILNRAQQFRNEFGYCEYAGDSVEFHASGLITLPLLGTRARLEDKLAFDPDRAKRRSYYERVCELFSEYYVVIGGSSSFDIAPKPYGKLFALDRQLEKMGLFRENVVFFGDDYGVGGNDRDVYLSGITFCQIDDYRTFPQIAEELLLLDR